MDDKEFLFTLVSLVSVGITFVMLLFMEVRAHWRQREELNKLLIVALFRMSNRQIKAAEEQTKRLDALLSALRPGARVDASALVEEGEAEQEVVAEDEAEGEARSGERGRRVR